MRLLRDADRYLSSSCTGVASSRCIEMVACNKMWRVTRQRDPLDSYIAITPLDEVDRPS
jgi:hypothetical protein